MMTREEAIKTFEDILQLSPTLDETGCSVTEAMKVALSALRPVSRERVEKVWRGEWIVGEPNGLGFPIHCSRCGWGSDHADQRKWMEYKGHLFCGHCGALMTDEAVQMVMERMEALHDKDV